MKYFTTRNHLFFITLESVAILLFNLRDTTLSALFAPGVDMPPAKRRSNARPSSSSTPRASTASASSTGQQSIAQFLRPAQDHPAVVDPSVLPAPKRCRSSTDIAPTSAPVAVAPPDAIGHGLILKKEFLDRFSHGKRWELRRSRCTIRKCGDGIALMARGYGPDASSGWVISHTAKWEASDGMTLLWS